MSTEFIELMEYSQAIKMLHTNWEASPAKLLVLLFHVLPEALVGEQSAATLGQNLLRAGYSLLHSARIFVCMCVDSLTPRGPPRNPCLVHTAVTTSAHSLTLNDF